MKTHPILASLLVASSVNLWSADPPPAPATPATPAPTATAPARRVPNLPLRSPEVLPDGRVTFRLRAPNATEVTLNGQWTNGKTNLLKDTNGVWSATVGPIEPGVYEYSFQLDGLGMIDPGNPAIKPMREPRTSILHLPAQPPRNHDWQDVPHGTVRSHTYASKSLGRLRELQVYTPPGYDQHPDLQYPVLYLQHGMGDNQATWTVHGKAHWILDNLIAQGRAVPMLIVMMDGHAVVPGTPGNIDSNTQAFERDLLSDVIPYVESNYRVKKDPSGRALVGLSMGGGQSLTTGLNHPDTFAWVGGFSSATPAAESVASALSQPTATNDKLKLLWIACGKNDFLLARNQEFIQLLQSKNLKHEWHLTEGDHSWPVWRLYLADIAPRLFQ